MLAALFGRALHPAAAMASALVALVIHFGLSFTIVANPAVAVVAALAVAVPIAVVPSLLAAPTPAPTR